MAQQLPIREAEISQMLLTRHVKPTLHLFIFKLLITQQYRTAEQA